MLVQLYSISYSTVDAVIQADLRSIILDFNNQLVRIKNFTQQHDPCLAILSNAHLITFAMPALFKAAPSKLNHTNKHK